MPRSLRHRHGGSIRIGLFTSLYPDSWHVSTDTLVVCINYVTIFCYSISTRKILLTCDLQAKITGISEATVVRRSFVNPPPQLLSSVPSSPGPMSSDTIAAQRARDLSMLGCTLIEAAIGRPVAIDDVEANLNRIEWPELQTILARCFHEEGYKADHLLAHLFQLIMSGSFTAYDRCAPRRYIRRLDTGLIFDAPAKAHTLPAIP
eukprot:m.185683 g.185683  ORF g.185683 m.185683 type:complete len:205 (-) comp16916_c0_seq9:3419-4033(-)